MPKKRFLAILVLVVSLVTLGALVLSIYSTVARKALTLDQILTVQGSNYGYKVFSTYSARDYNASFTVSSGTIKSCSPLSEGLFQQWQQGQYEPNWVETNHAEYELTKSADISPEYTGSGAVRLFYFVFNNENSITREVRLQVTELWNEMNTINMSVGAATILIGAILGFWSILTLKKPIHNSLCADICNARCDDVFAKAPVKRA